MLNEYEWHPTTGNKKPRNQEIYSKKITGLYHVMFNLESPCIMPNVIVVSKLNW